MVWAPPAPVVPTETPTRPVSKTEPPVRTDSGVIGFIKAHPILSYYTVVFAISWGGVLLLVGGPGAIPGTPQQIDSLIWFVVLTLELGPPVAGLLLTGVVSGRPGYAELFKGLLRWRVGARWYAVALLTAPLVAIAVLFGLSLTSSEYSPAIVTADDKTSVLLVGLITGLLGGFGEELGWTGFATPRLRLQHSVMATGLFMGVLWGVWHFLVTPAWIAGTYAGELPVALFLTLTGVLALVGQLTPYRVLMVWVYDRTGSLLVASLMHASLIGTSLFILSPAVMTGWVYVTWMLVLSSGFWLVVGGFRMANGQLSLHGPVGTGVTSPPPGQNPTCAINASGSPEQIGPSSSVGHTHACVSRGRGSWNQG